MSLTIVTFSRHAGENRHPGFLDSGFRRNDGFAPLIEICGTKKVLFQDHEVMIAIPSSLAKGFTFGSVVNISEIFEDSKTKKSWFSLLIAVLGIPLIMLAWTIANNLLFPLKGVEEGLKKVAEGNFQIRLSLNRKDELGLLTNSFDMMIKGIEERFELGRFVSGTWIRRYQNPSTAKSLIRSGKER